MNQEATSGSFDCLRCGRTMKTVLGGQTSFCSRACNKRYVYEELYCARGEMENRIKEQQLDLFGDRASSHTFRGNEIRLCFSMAAHVLIAALRRLGLVGTELANAQAGTLRVRLLKIGVSSRSACAECMSDSPAPFHSKSFLSSRCSGFAHRRSCRRRSRRHTAAPDDLQSQRFEASQHAVRKLQDL